MALLASGISNGGRQAVFQPVTAGRSYVLHLPDQGDVEVRYSGYFYLAVAFPVPGTWSQRNGKTVWLRNTFLETSSAATLAQRLEVVWRSAGLQYEIYDNT